MAIFHQNALIDLLSKSFYESFPTYRICLCVCVFLSSTRHILYGSKNDGNSCANCDPLHIRFILCSIIVCAVKTTEHIEKKHQTCMYILANKLINCIFSYFRSSPDPTTTKPFHHQNEWQALLSVLMLNIQQHNLILNSMFKVICCSKFLFPPFNL